MEEKVRDMMDSKPAGKKQRIGLVYHSDYLIHTQDQHPERKERLEHILKTLNEQGLMDLIQMIEPEPAPVSKVALVHEPAHISSIEEACRRGQHHLDMDTYLVPQSFEIALLAAGGALTGLREIFKENFSKIFSLNRPPGHHAESDRAMGFCLFNNAAIAAATARRDYGLKRVAIVDWDVHHGNGTQQIFFNDPDVLFISIHQSPAFPGTGSAGEVGGGKGEGYTINIPLPASCSDGDYAVFFERVVIPVLDSYEPELIIVSAGQDAYHKDPLAGMNLTWQGYFNMAEALSLAAERHCKGRMLLCLEGGYNLQGQAGAVVQILNALGDWGLPIPEHSPSSQPSPQALQRLQEVLLVQQQYWPIE